MLSVAGLLLRHKLLAWTGLLTCVACLATTRYSRLDVKQLVTPWGPLGVADNGGCEEAGGIRFLSVQNYHLENGLSAERFFF